MKELTYQELLDAKQEIASQVRKEYPVSNDLRGIDVEVSWDSMADSVIMKIDGRTIYLSRLGARDLAQALRQAANILERKK